MQKVDLVKKRSLITVLLLLGISSAAYGSHNNAHNGHDRYNKVQSSHILHNKRKHRFAKVVRSVPIYKEVITYRNCRPNHRRHLLRISKGPVHGILNRHHRHSKHCREVEQRLVGYKNIAYWHGKKIVRVSDRPLSVIRVHRKRHNLSYAKR